MSQDADAVLEATTAQIRKDWNLSSTRTDQLFTGEPFWRDHQPWLLERGYSLRARYQPDWTPSWTTNGRSRQECEDGHRPKVCLSQSVLHIFMRSDQRVYLMDAVRISDGSFVVLKKLLKESHPHETDIGQYFSTRDLRADIHNHAVPVLDVLDVPDDERLVILVMPLLRKFDDPPFGTLGEVIDCVKQAFEVRPSAFHGPSFGR
jgi:hypothetical protein